MPTHISIGPEGTKKAPFGNHDESAPSNSQREVHRGSVTLPMVILALVTELGLDASFVIPGCFSP